MKFHPSLIALPFSVPVLLLWQYFSTGSIDRTGPSRVFQNNPHPNCTTVNKPGWSMTKLQNLPYGMWPMHSCLLGLNNDLTLRQLISEWSPNMYDAASRGFLGYVQFYVATDGSQALCRKSDGNDKTSVQIALANQRLNILRFAASIRSLDLVECVLKDVYASNLTPAFKTLVYRSAIRSGNLKAIKYLVEEKKAYTINLSIVDDVNGLLKLVGWTEMNLVDFNYFKREANKLGIKPSRLIQSRLLSRATITGHMDALGFLLDTLKFDVNLEDEHGWSPAHSAAFWGNIAVLEFLVEVKGANVNSRTHIGNTLLHTATSTHGSVPVIKYLLENKRLDVNAQNHLDQTPIYFAVWNGRLSEVVHLAKNNKTNLYVRDSKNNRTLVHLAAYMGHLNVLKYLIDDLHLVSLINETETYGYTPAMNAARCMVRENALPILRYLVDEKGASTDGVNLRGLDILIIAANEKMMSVVRYLISEKGFDPYKKCTEGDPVYVGKSAYDLLEGIHGIDQDSEWFGENVKPPKSPSFPN